MDFPQEVIDRVVARQGALHLDTPLDPRETAFVVIDLQNYFTDPAYQCGSVAPQATFPAVNHLAQALRAAGGVVAWVQTCSDGADDFWSVYHHQMRTPESSAQRLRELSAQHTGYALADALQVAPGDLRLVKRMFSAMLPHSCNLHEQLQARGIRNVLIGGTTTNVCCESTARDAMMMNYRTIMVEDTLSGVTAGEHEHSLRNWILYFGDVLSSDQVIDRFP